MIRSNEGDRKNPWTGGRNGEKRRVMIVENHAAFRQALALVLEQRAGFDVCAEVASTAEARRALELMDGGVDLAVVDLDLPEPGMEGLVRELRGLASGAIAVLGLTNGRGGALTGASDVLGTDVPVDEIVVAARQLVG